MGRTGQLQPLTLLLGKLAIVALVLLVCIRPVAATQAAATDLAEQVTQLAQDCQNGASLTPAQLQQVISRADELNKTVLQSNHPQKKLLIIRLKKSRNLCRYLQQLQQNK